MLCPRGNHGYLAKEHYPIRSFFCIQCGHREYPGYIKREGGPMEIAPRPHMSGERKKARAQMVANMIDRDNTPTEIAELTGFSKNEIYNAARTHRRKQKNLDTA